MLSCFYSYNQHSDQEENIISSQRYPLMFPSSHYAPKHNHYPDFQEYGFLLCAFEHLTFSIKSSVLASFSHHCESEIHLCCFVWLQIVLLIVIVLHQVNICQITYYLFILLLTDTCVLQFEAIANKAAMNILRYVPW